MTTLYSCSKNDDVVNPLTYELPWKTEHINYKNNWSCNSGDYAGYKLYYKDKLIKEECSFERLTISDSTLVNDSILHLYLPGYLRSYVLTTYNGGLDWGRLEVGPPFLLKLHVVNSKLSYCITHHNNYFYVTGIGESGLSVYKDSLTNGTHHITDLETNILDRDSTTIKINNDIDLVINFK